MGFNKFDFFPDKVRFRSLVLLVCTYFELVLFLPSIFLVTLFVRQDKLTGFLNFWQNNEEEKQPGEYFPLKFALIYKSYEK